MILGKMNVSAAERLVDRLLVDKLKPQQKRKIIIKDVRIFFSTVDRAVATMRQAGVAADMKIEEQSDRYACTIMIEKRG